MRKTYPVVLMAMTIGLLTASAPLRADQTDSRIESSAKKTYIFKTYLKDDSIKVSAKDGVVTLTGTVADGSHRSMAQDTVEGLPGVQRVDNQLEIKDKASTVNYNSAANAGIGDKTELKSDGKPDAKSEDRPDGWIATKVRTELLFHRSVSLHRTEVTVKDGIVTLRGEAKTQAEKDLASEYAKDIEGVKGVQNEMTVGVATERADNDKSDRAADKSDRTFGEKVDDASVTAEVKSSLLAHRSTSALRTKVETRDGVVTLTGTARNTAEKDLVSKLVGDINGVKSVKNEMTVEAAGS